MFALILCGLFTDHSVLQRGQQNPVWGEDRPAQVVTLTIEDLASRHFAPVQTVTDANGKWRLLCPELPVGGPYRLHISGSTERVLEDVLVGDVWVASGQSNMEFQLSRAQNADVEISNAKYSEIRFAKIPRTTSVAPMDTVTTSWEVCAPQQAPQFSAVAYFFAREIFEKTHVPIGIIDSTWGGTPVEAWTSREGLRPVMAGVDGVLDRLASNGPEMKQIRSEYQAKLQAWQLTAFPQDTENTGEKAGWAKPTWDDASWKRIKLPATVQSQGLKANGVFWFRRTVTVPDTWKGQDLELDLGMLDDFDSTYFNGERVGGLGADIPDAYQTLRHYRVPGRLVRSGQNVISVRIFDHFGEGGFMGPAVAMQLRRNGEKAGAMDLSGEWRWAVEREIPLVPSSVYASMPPTPPEIAGSSSPAALFNGMIAPVIPYGIRGFIWYQGEANVRNHTEYRDRFTAMIRDWRGRWGQGTLPFYFVQLAAFRETPGWPYLREAQSATRAEPATGMAVALDVGNRDDIHPTNKQAVGRRLALLALADVYGEKDIVNRGPFLKTVTMEPGQAVVHLANADGLRTRDGAAVKGFAIAGADGVYVPVEGKIVGDTVVLKSAKVPEPKTVRYGWADYLEVNLENAVGLPAEPFRTDNAKME
jgi:sialate O-acetylesterase